MEMMRYPLNDMTINMRAQVRPDVKAYKTERVSCWRSDARNTRVRGAESLDLISLPSEDAIEKT